VSAPESVLAGGFFPKGGYRPAELFEKIVHLLHELPTRPKTGKPNQAAVWVKNNKGTIAVTCSQCPRTFSVSDVLSRTNEAECDFCSCIIRFEIIGERTTQGAVLTHPTQSFMSYRLQSFPNVVPDMLKEHELVQGTAVFGIAGTPRKERSARGYFWNLHNEDAPKTGRSSILCLR
jgi:hypothetical protein